MKKIFADVNNEFLKDETDNDIGMLYNTDSIDQALFNLIRMRPYDNPFHPEVTSNIYNSLFELISKEVAFIIRTNIELVVENFEPRVELIDVDVIANMDENGYMIVIKYRPINSSSIFSYSDFLERVR